MVEGTMLLHLNFALKQDQQLVQMLFFVLCPVLLGHLCVFSLCWPSASRLFVTSVNGLFLNVRLSTHLLQGKDVLKVLKVPGRLGHPFALALLLSLSRIQNYRDSGLALLKASTLNSVQ